MAIPTFVKATPQSSNSIPSPASYNFSGGNTTGNVIVLFLGIRANLAASPVTSVVDTEGNTYVQKLAGKFNDASNNMWREIWLAQVTNGSGSTNTVTVTWTGGTQANNMAAEYTGASATPYDTSVGKAAGASNPTSTTINCAGPNEVIVGCGEFQGGGDNYTSTTFTFRTNVTNALLAIGDQAGVSGSNTINMSCTISGRPSLVAVSLFPGGNPLRTLMGVGT